jgi:hypothetical protein
MVEEKKTETILATPVAPHKDEKDGKVTPVTPVTTEHKV